MSSLGSSVLESYSSLAVGHYEVVEFDHADSWRSADVSDVGCEGLGIGEGLALLAVGVDDETDLGGSCSVVGNGVGLEHVAPGHGDCESMGG